MNSVLKTVLFFLAAIFILVLILSFMGVNSNRDSFSFFKNNSFLQNSITPSINYDDYLDKQVVVYGHYELYPVLCRAQKDCNYDVIFIDKTEVFSNLSVYSNGRPISCYDEYSLEPRKYLHTVCGVRYIDRTINREKFEQKSFDFSAVQNYTFTVMKNLNEYYLDMN
jgi:hypothetical protein